MKFMVSVLLTAYLGYVIGVYTHLPWWSFACTSMLVALLVRQSPFSSFIAGFLGMFLLWFILAWIKDTANQHILSQRVAPLLKMGSSSMLLILVTGLVGGLVSGFAATFGYQLSKSAKAILSIKLE
jgi:hypothetical protein